MLLRINLDGGLAFRARRLPVDAAYLQFLEIPLAKVVRGWPKTPCVEVLSSNLRSFSSSFTGRYWCLGQVGVSFARAQAVYGSNGVVFVRAGRMCPLCSGPHVGDTFLGWSRPTPRVFADACAALVAHQAAEPVHVDRQHRQAHHQRKVLRTLLAYQRTAAKSKVGQTRFDRRMLLPRRLERGCAFAHTVRLIQLALRR